MCVQSFDIILARHSIPLFIQFVFGECEFCDTKVAFEWISCTLRMHACMHFINRKYRAFAITFVLPSLLLTWQSNDGRVACTWCLRTSVAPTKLWATESRKIELSKKKLKHLQQLQGTHKNAWQHGTHTHARRKAKSNTSLVASCC